MDDRTTTDFVRTKPVDAPAPPHKTAAPKKGRWRLGLVLILIAAAGAWWFYGRAPAPQQPQGRGNQFANAMPVVAAPVVIGDIDITLNALGTVTSLATVTVKSQISGYLMHVLYQEGQVVKQGDLLVEIDSRPYELALRNAEGALERDQAMLQSAELDLKRYQELAKTNAIPRQQLDQQVALVAQDRGNVVSDQAQIDTQKLNIIYCHIIAPVTGRVGLRLVDQGNYVTPGDATGLVVITQFQPITVIFPVAEDNLPQIVKRIAVAKSLPVTAFDRSGTVKLATGQLKTLDNQIDTTTGTLKLRAEFANEDNTLFPNQFVNVQVLVDTLKGAPVMSTSAVQRGAPGTFAYVVNADNSVSVKPVTLGPSYGERVAIQSGLSPGDRVVIDGADKLRNGAKVVARDATAPGATGSAASAAATLGVTPGGAAAPGTATPETAAPGSAAPGASAPDNAPPAPERGGGRRSRGGQQ
jgi:multidrug efflux system membrane fusion protein